jgi:peptidyl-prolyl cis-trans isomerase D
MAKTAGKTLSNLFVWIILGLLFVALAGFGIGSFSGSGAQVGEVGEVEITADDYARALEQEIRARINQTGEPVTLSTLQAQGADQAVLQSLVARAALSNEAQAMGLSVGDEEVARQITEIESFQGVDGQFDRQAYEVTLRQNGLDPAEFEQDVREDTARSLLQLAVVGGVPPDDTLVETLVAYRGETRDFSLLTITEADLPAGLPAPTDAELRSFYEDNPDSFTRPESRRISYAWVTPSMIMDDMEIDEAALRALYEDRAERYRQPERRLLEQLTFREEEEAQAARDAIAAGETSFDALVEARDLTLDDIDLGEVARDDLPAETAEAIFSDTESEIIGPLESTFGGAALFRVNAVLDATEVPFDQAREELRAELAADAARRAIDDLRDPVDDLLAGGATLEELADETRMRLGQIDYTPTSEGGIAGYDAFREAAQQVEEGDFPELLELSDGGLFALRLDETVPPTLPPFAEIEAEVAAAWRESTLRAQLRARGEALVERLSAGAALEDLGRVATEMQVGRQDFIPDAPRTLVPQVFELEAPGDTVFVPAADRAIIARLDAIDPVAPDDRRAQVLSEMLGQRVAQSMAQDIFEAYGRAVQAEAGISLNQSMIDAVHSQFP